MAQFVLHNAKVILERGVQPGGVLVRDGRISQIFSRDETPTGLSAGETIDLKDSYLAPGLIDIHIHGSAGVDVQSTDEAGLTKLSTFLLNKGVTGYFATLVPANEQSYRATLETISSRIKAQDSGASPRPAARILGVHFEGPFVSEA